MKSSPRGGRRVRAPRPGGRRHLRRHRPQPRADARATGPPSGSARRPSHMISGVPAHVDGRMPGIAEDAGGDDRQPGPDVALHRGHPQLGPDLARPRDPDHPRPVVDVVRRHRQAARGMPGFPGFDIHRRDEADPRRRPRLLVVRAHPVDHREGVRALGLRAEPRHHRQGPRVPRSRAGSPRARPARSRRSRSTARTSSSPTTWPSWSPG